ncbi:MAG: hypothetical protein RLZ25_1891 [Pseudomonadota bacterium]|jgi:PAS domain S-box-containing protein
MPWRQLDGSIAGGIAFIEVITNAVDAEENLRFVLYSAEIGIWERDFIQNKVRLSSQAERLLGYLPGTFGDKPETFDALVHPDDLNLMWSATERAIQHKTPIRIQFRVLWPDGSIHWLYGLSEFEYSRDGTPIRLRGASIDITESKQLESELKALTVELEARVKERTQELQLALEAKSGFLANVSHEIRNPLNSVTLMSKLLEDQSLDEDKRKSFAGRISAATKVVIGILDEILDFSRIEAGHTTLEMAPFDLTELLDEVRSIFEVRAAAKGLHLEVFADSCDCLLLGDRQRLQQVLFNLIGNALKFTEIGGVCLKANYQRKNNDLIEFTFEVIDTGIGINKEAIGTLFDPFTQADSGTTRKYGGTGLGLSISKNLVALMGGRLDVKTTPGLGSTFSFAIEMPMARQIDYKAHSEVTDQVSPLRFLRILLVDDDQNNIETMRLFLESMKATVLTAMNGAHALEILQSTQQPFDLILMDIQMPVMDGITATKIIRNDLNLKSIPIIAITAGVLPHQQQEAISAGITELIRKPVDHKSLTECLLRYRHA